MKRFPIVVALIALAVCAASPAALHAQSKMDEATAAAGQPKTDGASPSPAAESKDASATEAPDASRTEKPVITAMPSPPGNAVLADPDTKQKYLDAMQRYYEYRANGYSYRSRVFEWQLLSSRLIFVVVLSLVGAGMYFAAIQFRAAMRPPRTRLPAGVAVVEPGAGLATQLEVSAKGIVVNSSVMGVIILALSLAFFYLYLVYVYPITDVI